MKAILVAGAFALAPLCAAHAQQEEPAAGGTAGAASPEMQQVMTDALAFVQTAAASNQWEIESSELALDRSQNEDVQAFAQQMIEDHGAVGERLEARVDDREDELVDIDTLGMDTKHAEMLTRLQEASDEEFDSLYLQMQLQAHQEAVALFEGFAANGNDDDLRAFAEETLPSLQGHLEMVQQMAPAQGG
jgi:putative membrane protein